MTPAAWVRHQGGRYPVLVRAGLIRDLGGLAAQWLPGRRLAVITDRTVARVVSAGIEAPTLVVAPGEISKSRSRWSTLTDRLLDLGFGRDAGIVALGGGVVGDLAGFVAATYLRGVPWLMAPTSLIAMVDASVGGKTGINTRHGKNLVGAFHPPAAVLADPEVLATLHSDHLAAGLVEAIKHGLIADAEYFGWIESRLDALLQRDPEALTELISRSVVIKSEIVSEDEREAGRRAVLNAGHTVGHAVEQVSRYSISHGDAIAIGLVVESALARDLGLAGDPVVRSLRSALERLGRPVTLDPAWAVDDLMEAMQYDKKSRNGAIRFVLPNTLGSAAREGGLWTVPVPPATVRRILQDSFHS